MRLGIRVRGERWVVPKWSATNLLLALNFFFGFGCLGNPKECNFKHHNIKIQGNKTFKT